MGEAASHSAGSDITRPALRDSLNALHVWAELSEGGRECGELDVWSDFKRGDGSNQRISVRLCRVQALSRMKAQELP